MARQNQQTLHQRDQQHRHDRQRDHGSPPPEFATDVCQWEECDDRCQH
jgi:hypothetical protein